MGITPDNLIYKGLNMVWRCASDLYRVVRGLYRLSLKALYFLRAWFKRHRATGG
ncbi:hypothetical protein HBZS_121040 [Helicobacter bizzozeronii CCUG 35545]|nr:hypothetical protein HBZS_121040 [Helicobacter bizzozeronii CCUG 35545]